MSTPLQHCSMFRNCNRSFHCIRCLLTEGRRLSGLNCTTLNNRMHYGSVFSSHALYLQFQAGHRLRHRQTRANGIFRSVKSLVLQKTPARAAYTLARRSSLMSQFRAVKEQYKDYVLLFQVGDFYELYGKDAELVTEKTTLRVTRKQGILMAGFPVRSLDEWLKVLVEEGFQVAICNQRKEE